MVDITMEQMLFLLRKCGGDMVNNPGNELSPELVKVMDHSWLKYGDPWLVHGYSSDNLLKSRSRGANVVLMDVVFRWITFITNRHIRLVVVYRTLWDTERGRSIWSTRRLADLMDRTPQTIRNWETKGYDTMHQYLSREDDMRVYHMLKKYWEEADV